MTRPRFWSNIRAYESEYGLACTIVCSSIEEPEGMVSSSHKTGDPRHRGPAKALQASKPTHFRVGRSLVDELMAEEDVPPGARRY